MLLSESSPAIVRKGIFRDIAREGTQSPVTVSIRQGELPVNSQSVLSFVQTAPHKPQCLLLTITQKEPDTPVTLTTDAPAYFRLAADSRPAFLPTLTLTPPVENTYVHVRYLASENGRHTGQLIIQVGHESMTVRLEGRKTGLLPAIQSQLPVGRQPAALSRLKGDSLTKRLRLLVALTIVLGIGYAAFTWHQSPVPAPPRFAEISSVNGMNPLSARSGPGTISDKNSERKTSIILKKGRKTSVFASGKTVQASRSTPAPPVEKKGGNRTLQAPAVVPISQPRLDEAAGTPQKVTSKSNKKRHRPTGPETAVSELERLLNQPR